MAHSRVRRAFTLVEVLVVIAILGILLGLLLPAITQARSAARQSACGNNLKQLANAVEQFHGLHNTLPVYWGAMKAASGRTKFGGWLLHMLPQLEQQAFYDSLPDAELDNPVVSQWTGKTLPAVPPSPDYVPGTYVTSTVGWITRTNIQIPIIRVDLVGQIGRPGRGPRREYIWVKDTSVTKLAGIPQGFGQAQSKTSLPVLQCVDDTGSTPGAMAPFVDPSGTNNWSTTNYLANTHVFVKFGNGARLGGALAGLFNPPPAANASGLPMGNFSHVISGTASTVPRKFDHVADGLSNTILFGEAMRQCDGGNSWRAAFLPSGMQTHEHSFGIEVSSLDPSSGSFLPGSTWNATYGNTLMFQSRPGLSNCNPFRVQANHGDVYMVAMCDGSVRAISNLVTRREAVGPEASGRDGFGTMFYTSVSRGGGAQDGIWDMLMVPADPPGNVLANTGEVGHEK